MQHLLAHSTSGLASCRPVAGSRRALPTRQQRSGALRVRAVAEMNKQATSNGAAAADAAAVAADIEAQRRYRLAAKSSDPQTMYQAGEQRGRHRQAPA